MMQDYITLLHSLFAIATPFALLSPFCTPFELIHALRSSKVTRLFVHPKYLSFVQHAAKDVGFPDSCIYILEGHVKGRRSFDEMIHHVCNECIRRLAVRHAGKDTLAYLIFSSGTSGLPKG
jgi:acyl-CoA synthetase (AMP-forming)/AMP-acid ligase II